MELHSQSTISRPNDGRWREYWWFVLIFYPVAGFFFYNWHQEEAPTALAWSLFVLSPLLICVAGVIGYGLLMLSLVGVHHFFESKWFKSYEGALFHAQRQSELAKKEGRRFADWAWRLVFFVLALPIIIIALSWAAGAE